MLKIDMVECGEGENSLNLLLFSLGLQGNFHSTRNNILVAEYLAGMADRNTLELLAKRIEPHVWERAQNELELAKDKGLKVCNILSCEYPEALKSIADPPLILFYRGSLSRQPRVAIVGTRKCTEHARRVAHGLGFRIARVGASVVSGLAYGVDAASHRGAIRAATKRAT